MNNAQIADVFETIGHLLEFQGDNPFRIRAYRRAALNLRTLTADLAEVAQRGALEELPGIGKDLAAKIQELLATGRLAYFEELSRRVPKALVTLVSVPGIGPKKARLLYDRLHVTSLDQLEDLARRHKLRGLPGMEAKTEENILQGLQVVRQGQARMPLGAALALANEVMKPLAALPSVRQIVTAGSVRRRQESIGDIDLLAVSSRPGEVMDRFVTLPQVAQILAHGRTKSSIRTAGGVQVDLRVVEPDSFGAALVYFTGSKQHNVTIRGLANRRGLLVNEYGVFREKTHRRLAGATEEEVYRALGLPWIPPELREDRGEVGQGMAGTLPELVTMDAIRGDFHLHSDWSDGAHPIEEVAAAVKRAGYEYMLLSDHSHSLKVAGGLTAAELLKQRGIVERLNARLAPFRILLGTEMEILPDGRLDYPDTVLAKLDVVIAAVHSAFKQPRAVMTRRIVKAIRNPYVHILAHPTGRLWGQRAPYDVDLDEVARAAAQTGAALEINAYPTRMDLNDRQARRARELGALLAISTDTHALTQLETFELGLSMARRAGLTAKDVLNTRRVHEVLKWAQQKPHRRDGRS
ncbi:MAG: DNA polymerase/3'-5' exonuclease PolX [Candidatus Omnitrophica bacterium]|nr:DNA polymerase/3'-5' exonuclease PolX [Candidatus Omnitrophota bacterium]